MSDKHLRRKLLLLGIRHKIHSGYDVRVWEDPWIPTTPARPARSVATVMHLNMRVSDIINQESKEWDAGLLDNYVHPEDIPLIRSMAISSTHRRDTFCWNYTRNGQYSQIWILGCSKSIEARRGKRNIGAKYH
ncbi:hypothetical protein Bca52824_058248 [Brassica carinata]|uniref:Uncharacterized protein n=1 Tax=Brassica carinata TaxID=52824 RepID=A0A8X7QSG9_BRACI|nr:hypothetical protein Bca52824_058248 [Brassica carinata]